ncbi:hypothetical protein D9756_001381 [Leucocoprinus leucothites]|uniref:Uncharacterized protein n=1 Tax=Leucocoprinus leucothites TaxID=201217 RepID=A0A8H5G3U1_9AGAR|nr:hypothetical protein D9756_001381 [Leucoagaricus leucothites]
MPPRKKQKQPKEDEDTDAEVKAFEEIFQSKRRRLYEGARGSIKDLAATCTRLLEQTRTQTLEMKSQELELQNLAKDYQQWDVGQDDAYKQWHKKYHASARELGHSRSIKVDTASKMLNTSSKERKDMLQETLKAARLQMEQSKEREKLATDASALIRHYKSLLIVPAEASGKQKTEV